MADLKERNRASARASRERKKLKMSTLHKQLDELTSHNVELAEACQNLVEDSKRLRDELAELKKEMPAPDTS